MSEFEREADKLIKRLSEPSDQEPPVTVLQEDQDPPVTVLQEDTVVFRKVKAAIGKNEPVETFSSRTAKSANPNIVGVYMDVSALGSNHTDPQTTEQIARDMAAAPHKPWWGPSQRPKSA